MRGLAILAAAGLVAGCGTLGVRDRSELVQTQPECVTTVVPVYFGEGEAGLTDPARQAITTAADTLRPCTIHRVRVVGLASATGSAAANMTLSEQRAVTVAEVLASAGLPTPAFELEAEGDAGAVSGGVAEPVRRRVEVVVEARPR